MNNLHYNTWYNIPGFPGYYMNTDKQVMTMKHYKKYPYGFILKPSGNYYNLSDYKNQRRRLHQDEIYDLILYTKELKVLGSNEIRNGRNNAFRGYNPDKQVKLKFNFSKKESSPKSLIRFIDK